MFYNLDFSFMAYKVGLMIGLIGVPNNDISHFKLGEERYCYTKMAEGVTRAQWYYVKINEQEARLKKTVEEGLCLTPQDISYFQKKALETIAEEEATIITQEQIDPCGTWVKDDIGRTYRKVDKNYQPANNSEFVFNVTSMDIENCKKLAREAGHTGEIIFINYDGYGGMIAMHSLIKVQIDVLCALIEFGYETKVFISFLHEIFHIKNQDILWDYTIKEYVKSLPTYNCEGMKCIDLKSKGITVARYDESLKAFQDWFIFHERRADMQAYLEALKFPEILEIITCPRSKQSYLSGQYPLSTFAYQNNSPVPYCRDFEYGIKFDEKNV